MGLPDEVADALGSIAHTERYRRIWRAVRVAMLVMLSIFLTLLVVYTGLAFAAQKGVWHYSFLLVGDAFLAFLIVMVLRHRDTERMFDAEVATATERLRSAGYRPVLKNGRVLAAPLGAPDEAAVEV